MRIEGIKKELIIAIYIYARLFRTMFRRESLVHSDE